MKYYLQILFLFVYLSDCSAQVQLDWSSMVNIIGRTDPTAMKVDAAGNSVITGFSDTSNYIALFDSGGQRQWIYLTNSGWSVQDVLISQQGDIYATGSRDSEDPGFYGAFLMKLNANGELQWNRSFELISNALSILEDSIGQVIIGGMIVDTIVGTKFFITKYDHTGNVLWNHEYGEPNDPLLAYIDYVKLKKNQQEELYMAGTIHYGFSGDSDKVFLFKYSSAGIPLWTNSIYQANLEPDNFSLDPSGNAIISFYPLLNSNFTNELIQYDASGGIIQNYNLGINTIAIRTLPDGSLLACGQVLDSLQPWISYPSLKKLDASGNVIWEQFYQNFEIKGFDADSSGSAYMLSGSDGTFVLQKTDPLGNLLWTIENNDSGLSAYGGRASILNISPNGIIHICGYFCHDSRCWSSHTALIKYHETVTGIDALTHRNSNLYIFPNPSSGDWIVTATDLDPAENIHILLMQSDGKIIREQTYSATTDLRISMKSSDLSSGVYILKLATANQVFSKLLIRY